MVELDEVTKSYALSKENQILAVQGVDLKIARGEFVVITGRSGSGKTTLLNLIAGLSRPTAGQVRVEGVDIWKLPDAQQSRLRAQKIGFVFQFPSLLPTLTAQENVAMPMLFHQNGARDSGYSRANELLKVVGLENRKGSYPKQLSAGQQQRVVIARAMINHPEIILADEPTSNLDEQTETEIMNLFQKIHRETGITIVLVTHSSQLIQYGSRSIRMSDGRIVN
jgi:ABC-type lipoprotein export system ATPase subunit